MSTIDFYDVAYELVGNSTLKEIRYADLDASVNVTTEFFTAEYEGNGIRVSIYYSRDENGNLVDFGINECCYDDESDDLSDDDYSALSEALTAILTDY